MRPASDRFTPIVSKGFLLAVLCLTTTASAQDSPGTPSRVMRPHYDVLIQNGVIYDGSGKPPFRGEVAIQGDSIVAVGRLKSVRAKAKIDATGLAVAPGFINMLSQADDSLIEDGRSQSDIRDRKSTRLNSSHIQKSRMPSSA